MSCFQKKKDHVAIAFKTILGNSQDHITLTDPHRIGKIPIPLRIGDYNNDGYPDLLVSTSVSGLKLLRSVPCTNDICSEEATQLKRRTFVAVLHGFEEVGSVPGRKVGGAFLDVDEDVSFGCLLYNEMVCLKRVKSG